MPRRGDKDPLLTVPRRGDRDPLVTVPCRADRDPLVMCQAVVTDPLLTV